MRKNVYILSDAHLGSWAIDHKRQQERRLVRFLDEIKDRAAAVYLLGDMFDFWYEWRYTVPKGYTRFLGKLSELTDMGVEVHYFTGNHDIWMFSYLEHECGVIMHHKPLTTEIYGKLFYLAHGDALGDNDRKFLFIRSVFHNRPQRLPQPHMSATLQHDPSTMGHVVRNDVGKALPHEARGRQGAAIHG